MCVPEWNMTFKGFLQLFLGEGKADSDLILHGSCQKGKSLIPVAVPLHTWIWDK